jgi:hypothetical protein
MDRRAFVPTTRNAILNGLSSLANTCGLCTVAVAFLACLPALATTPASDGARAVWAVPAALAAQRIPQVATSRDTTPTAITGVRVIDVARGQRVPAQTVVVRGTRITLRRGTSLRSPT